MTTTVTILISGNKACAVSITSPSGGLDQVAIVQPGSFTTKMIHGDQVLDVKEVGEFVN